MSTARNQTPIQDFVTQLRKFPESAFDQTEQIRNSCRTIHSTPTL